MLAFVRPPSDAIARCELTHLARSSIDAHRARQQHRAYVRTLEEALGGDRTRVPGVLPPPRVVRLPERPTLPDAVFVEDAAVAVGSAVVLARPGASSRRPEVDDIAPAVALAGGRLLGAIHAPGTLDGGDVLVLRRDGTTTVFVGISTRTNREGADQLGRLLGEEGRGLEPVRVPVRDCLHLKTAVSPLGSGAVLINPRWVDRRHFHRFEVEEVPEGEPFAANVLALGPTVLLCERWPVTRRLLERRGMRTVALDLSELEKAEAGPTCLSLRIETPPLG